MSPITLSRKTYNKKERGAYHALLRKTNSGKALKPPPELSASEQKPAFAILGQNIPAAGFGRIRAKFPVLLSKALFIKTIPVNRFISTGFGQFSPQFLADKRLIILPCQQERMTKLAPCGSRRTPCPKRKSPPPAS